MPTKHWSRDWNREFIADEKAAQASWKGCAWAIGVSAYRDIADSQARLRANTDSFHNLSTHIIETLFLSRFLCLVRPNGFYARNPNKSKYICTKMLYFPALFWEFGLEPIQIVENYKMLLYWCVVGRLNQGGGEINIFNQELLRWCSAVFPSE